MCFISFECTIWILNCWLWKCQLEEETKKWKRKGRYMQASLYVRCGWMLKRTAARQQDEWRICGGRSPSRVTWSVLCGYRSAVAPRGSELLLPDADCPEDASWHHVSLCLVYCHARYNPQEEDSVPPRPPLPKSYVPNPPMAPLSSPTCAGELSSSLHRPEDRKPISRNGPHSVSAVTSPLTLPSAMSSCHCSLLWFLF